MVHLTQPPVFGRGWRRSRDDAVAIRLRDSLRDRFGALRSPNTRRAFGIGRKTLSSRSRSSPIFTHVIRGCRRSVSATSSISPTPRSRISRCCSATTFAPIDSFQVMCRPALGPGSWPVSRRRSASMPFWQSRLVVGRDPERSAGRLAQRPPGASRGRVPLLENQSVRLTQNGRPFWLIGLGDLLAQLPHARRGHGADDLPAAISRNPDDAPAILLVHEPYLFPWVPDRIALTLVGSHARRAGQSSILGPPVHLLKRRSGKFIYGEYALGERKMIVSGGLGTSCAPVRILRPPEVVMVKLGGASWLA